MTFLIAAAGTGGHVYPGLAVGEALVAMGVDQDRILYVGGDRLEASVYPQAGFPFLQVEMRGLQRRLAAGNLTIPLVVARAGGAIAAAVREREVSVLVGMGGYLTVPTALAARSTGASLMVCEQNAHAGLANRFAARFAHRVFTSFPDTDGLPQGEWVGNPLRPILSDFERSPLAAEGMRRYRLEPGSPILGVFGGSLGAGVINQAVATMVGAWSGPPIQVLHLTGRAHHSELSELPAASSVNWVRLAFEDRMDLFYAVSDLVVARSGGAVAELTATATPALLIPGEFATGRHQQANAARLEAAGAAVVLPEARLGELPGVVAGLIFDARRLAGLAQGCRALARPDAAHTVAAAMLEAS